MKLRFYLFIIITSYCFASDSESIFNTDNKAHDITFGAIQRIREFGAQTAQEAKAYGIEWMHLGINANFPGPDPFEWRTDQGLYLSAESLPWSLYTPWGQVPIYVAALYHDSGNKAQKVFDAFCSYLRLSFVKNLGEDNTEEARPIKFYLNNYQCQISQEELEHYRGSDDQILSNMCGKYSLYKILAVGSMLLPEPTQLYHRKSKYYIEIKNNWNMRMLAYNVAAIDS